MKPARLSEKALRAMSGGDEPCIDGMKLAARECLRLRRALRKARAALDRAWSAGEHLAKSDTVPLSDAMGIIARALDAGGKP